MLLRIFLLAALAALLTVAGVLALNEVSGARWQAVAAEDGQRPWIQLQDGVQARFLTALDFTPAGGPAETRELMVNFELKDPAALSDHAKLISAADQLFWRVVMTPADTQGFKRAAVNFLISQTGSGDTTVQALEDFHYARREDAVWLRQAGAEDWKTAQDATYTPPEPETLDLGSVGTVEVDFFGEMFAPAGSTKALGVEMRTSTPTSNVTRKYAEIKALWNYLDTQKLKNEGFDYAEIQNFSDRKRGKFQVREYVYLKIARPAGGDWPQLPDAPAGADGKPVLTVSLSASAPGPGDAAALASAAVLAAVPALHQARRIAADAQVSAGAQALAARRVSRPIMPYFKRMK